MGAQGFPARWDTTPTQGSSSMIHRLKSCGALVCNDQLFTGEGCDTAEVFGCPKCFTSGRNVFKGKKNPQTNPPKSHHTPPLGAVCPSDRAGALQSGVCALVGIGRSFLKRKATPRPPGQKAALGCFRRGSGARRKEHREVSLRGS